MRTFFLWRKRQSAKPNQAPKPYFFLLSLIAVLLVLMITFLEGLGDTGVKTAGEEETPVALRELPPQNVPQEEELAPASGEPAGPAPEKPPQNEDDPPGEADYREVPQEPMPEELSQAVSPGAPPEKPSKVPLGSLVFVIDDVGNNLEQLDRFLRISGPITFAVMPQRPHTNESIRRIQAAGKSAILHQPMEPMGDTNPGKGALYVSMTEEEIWNLLDENLESTGPLVGMNNHMGSRATSDSPTMKAVLTYLKRRGMIFLDSATTASMVGEPLAADLGVTYIKRNTMFLDNDSDSQSIYNAIQEGKEIAKRSGYAVMIGHVMTEELAELLFELYPSFIEDGFTLKDLSELLHRNPDADPGD